MKLQARAAQLKTDIPALLLALSRRETPWAAKLLAGLTVAYALSPIDLIPDFIPVLGALDDLLLLPLLIAATVQLIPQPVLADCRRQAQARQAQGHPGKRWQFALPVIFLWLLLLFVLLRAIGQ